MNPEILELLESHRALIENTRSTHTNWGMATLNHREARSKFNAFLASAVYPLASKDGQLRTFADLVGTMEHYSRLEFSMSTLHVKALQALANFELDRLLPALRGAVE